MSFKLNEKQQRIRYIRVLEKFFTKTIALLKLENFDKEIFIKRTMKNYEDMKKASKVDLHTDYYTSLDLFINKIMSFIKNPSKSFEEERILLLKEANLLQKEKNKNQYKKNKHKKDGFDDEY